jgi:hypothetical protein
MRSRRLLVPLFAACIAAASAAPALADDVIADNLTRDTPISARAGVVAYSELDQATQLYHLVLQSATARRQAPIPGSAKPFDVSLGSDRRGRPVALYSRCKTASETGCDVYRYDLTSATEQKVKAVSGPTQDEAWPAQDGSLLTFVRRRSDGAPKNAEIRDCDLIFVKNLASTAPSRRLDRGSCARTTGLSIRGSRIVQVTFGSPPRTRFASQVRLLSAHGGAVKVLAQQTSGEESDDFASPSQSQSSVFLTRVGVHVRGGGNFVRLDIASRKLHEVPAHVGLTGALARDGHGSFWYVETPEPTDQSCVDAASAPCRLTRASSSPFGSAERTLTPVMTISAPSDSAVAPTIFGDPFALSGRLTRTVVRAGAVLRSDPLANVTVRLLRRVTDPSQPELHEAFAPTALTATTAADGSWSIPLAAPPAEPWFSAVTEGQPARTFAGRGTVGTVNARITLTVSGATFAGTVTPAQPGRTVKIQRLAKRVCQTAQNGQRFCNDTWDAVADASLNTAGSGFSVTIAAPPAAGTYSAALPFADQKADPNAYAGRSPDTPIG